MKVLRGCLLICLALSVHKGAHARREILDILDGATDLTHDEVAALRPFFEELQIQYDFVVSEGTQDDDTVATENEILQELRAVFSDRLPKDDSDIAELEPQPTTHYDSHLPSIEELIGEPNKAAMTAEQWNEYLDIADLLQDTLDDAQNNIDELVLRALKMESQLLQLNKSKILTYIYKALVMAYGISARVGRAAYCTYSHIPQLNESLHHVNDGIDCYTYTTGLVLRVQTQTVDTVATIKNSVLDLATVYRKVAAKQSTIGKISTIILNITKIVNSITASYTTATEALDSLQNELPDAAMASVQCGSEFVTTVPLIVETASNVTTCILFVDETTNDYDFMKPENERD